MRHTRCRFAVSTVGHRRQRVAIEDDGQEGLMGKGRDIVAATPPLDERRDQVCQTSWNRGVHVEDLAPLDRLTVYTSNSCYDLIVMCPATGHVLIRGGEHFPSYADAHVAGSPEDGVCLEPRGIYVGLRLALVHGGEGILTGRVWAIECARSAGTH